MRTGRNDFKGSAALVLLMQRYLTALLDPFVTILEVHKLMYFMQEAGERLQLSYKKAPSGPYAENLQRVLLQLEGYLVSGYVDGVDSPNKPLELVPGAVQDAISFLDNEPETRSRLNRVIDLMDGFESSFGLELLATVHWVVKREHAKSSNEVIARTYNWNIHKEKFTERQICLAYNILSQKGWLNKPQS